MINADDLPNLQDKQHNCIKRYFTNGFNKSEAYRYAYDCSNMSATSISVEASRFFKNPKITLWVAYYQQNQQEAVKEELKYSALDFFDECNELKMIALDCKDKYGNPNITAAIKATENKAKVCGLLKDQIINNGSVVQMPSVTINGEEMSFNIGEEVDGNSDPENT
jgi:hypothetical protein